MSDALNATPIDWRRDLPALASRNVSLREPIAGDLSALVELLSLSDASRFGIESPISELAVLDLIERVARDRAAGLGFAYVVTVGSSRTIVGLVLVKQLDLAFDAGEWEITLAPPVRGSGSFLDVARLVGSFAFGTVGARRLEARVPVQNGRANGALRKLGAVQEGVLRRSLRQGGEYRDQVLWSVLKDEWGDLWVSTAPRVH
jgi:RimJ/RimL family protein N-acetyltransferase